MADNINREHFLITYEVEAYQETLTRLTMLYEAGKRLETQLGTLEQGTRESGGRSGGGRTQAPPGPPPGPPVNERDTYINAMNAAHARGDMSEFSRLARAAMAKGITL